MLYLACLFYKCLQIKFIINYYNFYLGPTTYPAGVCGRFWLKVKSYKTRSDSIQNGLTNDIPISLLLQRSQKLS